MATTADSFHATKTYIDTSAPTTITKEESAAKDLHDSDSKTSSEEL
jgi:hypothetical protein